MEHLRVVAYQSVGRACGFAGFAIVCVLIGLSFDPVAATRTGGALTLIMTVVLLLKAQYARSQNYRDTELWIMLDKEQRPPKRFAQWAASTVLRDAYLRFAQYAAAVSAVFWASALVLSLAGL